MMRTESAADASLHRPRRWAVLAAYVAVAGMSQVLWLNFAPILSLVQSTYGVDELTANLLVLVFPLIYVFFSLHAGSMTDRRGYRFTVSAGAWLMAAFACVRIYDASFAALLIGQIGIAIAQPYIVNGISKLVTDWFSEEHGAAATGLGTMGLFLGMAIAMGATPPLVAALGLRLTMVVFAGLTIGAAALCTAVVRPNEQRRGVDAARAELGFKALLGDRRMIVLLVIAFLGVGEFNGLTAWLEQILSPHGIDASHAGMVGAVLILGGIVGAVTIPALSDRMRRRKPFLLVCCLGALATVYTLGTSDRFDLLLLVAALHGFFFLPALALVLEMCAQLFGARSAGAATALIMLTGNAGAVAIIIGMDAVKSGRDYEPAILMLVGLLAVTAVVATRTTETFPRSADAA